MTASPVELARAPHLACERGAADRAAGRAQLVLLRQGLCLGTFWTTFLGTLIAIACLSLISRQQTFETGAAREVRRLGAHIFEAHFSGRLPQGCLVGCGGFELTKSAAPEEVRNQTGRFWIDPEHGIVRWSPRDETPNSATAIPTAILIVPGALSAPLKKNLLCFWIPAALLATSGLALAVGNKSRPAVGSAGRVKRFLGQACAPFTLRVLGGVRSRCLLVVAVGLGLAFSLVPDWNRLVTCPDSRSYVENWPIRTPLTAQWIGTFDRDRTAPRTGSIPSEPRTIVHWAASHRYVSAVRAWKVLFAACVCVFVWWLASIVPWWMAASLILAAASFDAARGLWSTGMSGYLDVVLSEPLSYSLLLLLLASLCAYFARPSWGRGAAIVVCLNLLVLARPASVAIATVIAGVWIFHWRREGLAPACRRAGGMVGLFIAGIALHCTFNLVHFGHFRQHACAGMTLMTTALQVADAEDAKAFTDPQLARYAEQTIAQAVRHRQVPFNAGAADANCWRFAVPVYAAMYGASAEQEPFSADDVLTRVARTIILRHPLEFFRLAGSNFWRGFWQSWIHLPLLATCAAGFWLFRRSGDWRFLFVACLAALPFVAIIPGCVTNYPIDRYRSLTSFAEIWSLPLLVGLAATTLHENKRQRDQSRMRERQPTGRMLAA
jgi:hypothetical protein